jgi:hypothetical protein
LETDEDVGLPHIAAHGVSEAEVADVLRRPLETSSASGTRGS